MNIHKIQVFLLSFFIGVSVSNTCLADSVFLNGLKKLVESGNFDEARELVIGLAREGNPEVQLNLGGLYTFGVLVEKNPEEAHYWFLKAANQGNISAQNNVALDFRLGRGVEQNLAKALEWFKASAKGGHPTSQFNLAVWYEKGKVVEKRF